MFEIDFWELALVGVVTLLVFGPEQLPELARTAGRWLGRLSRMVATVRAEVDRELHLEELKQSFRQQALQAEFKGLQNDLEEVSDDLFEATEALEALEDVRTEALPAPLPMPPAKMRPDAQAKDKTL